MFRGHGPACRQAHAGRVNLQQLKVMSAIERCRTAALGGHVWRAARTAPMRPSPTTACSSKMRRFCVFGLSGVLLANQVTSLCSHLVACG